MAMNLGDEATIEHTKSRCALFQEAIELVGRRWTAAILVAAGEGTARYSEFLNLIEGISDRLLTQRLKELAAAGLLEREVVPTSPVQVRYALTQSGCELIAAMQPLGTWGSKWLGDAKTDN